MNLSDLHNLQDKKIAIIGLGNENLALTKYLISKNIKVTVCDIKEKGEIVERLNKDQGLSISFNLGPHYLDDLNKFDIIFRTPGIPYLNKNIQEAVKNRVDISSQMKLFFNLCPCPIIGITGTKGKGTTTTLIGEILKASGKKVWVGGNIGNAPVEFLDKLSNDDLVVLELSSFQLQDLGVSPHVAVVLDIKIDHLDYHKNNKEYIESKTNIVRHQTTNDFAVINADYLTSIEFATITKAQTYWFSRRKSVDLGAFVLGKKIILRTREEDIVVCNKDEVQLRGEHNLENITAAITASYLSGASL
ncbi:MAG: UDP-N-acetylmuramoylalanine--D-glutamate ligase [Candidatus Berkelbacteria bacterium]|nr:UDP-N-acetylmuramoylalanine--D-glutamate ligase [Candidatus Berkelbacteria bacterium]